jgi:hypothetical protein
MTGRRPPAPLETAIQSAVVDYWRVLGRPDTLVAAIPNAGAMGQPGLTKGLPDLLVLGDLPGAARVGFIELKRTSRSFVSGDQLTFGELCRKVGIPYAVAVGRDEPIAILEDWDVVRRAAA